MKTLYISDVDGSIYRAGQEELRESSRALFEQILSRGTLLTVASGRNLHGVFDLVQQAGITLPVIAYNGAVIYDFFDFILSALDMEQIGLYTVHCSVCHHKLHDIITGLNISCHTETSVFINNFFRKIPVHTDLRVVFLVGV